MKHVKLFEQFVTEARDSQIKSWAWDYYNTCEEIGQWERAVENQTVHLAWLESIDSLNQKIQDAIDHKKASIKRAANFVKKKTKKKMKLESEFESIKDTSKDADKLKDMACAAGMSTSGSPHFQDGLIEVMSNYGVPKENIKELEKITKEYQANLDKELKVGKKLKDEFEKFYANIK